MEPMDALDRAITHFGSQTGLAKKLGKKQGHVWHWRNVAKTVPPEIAMEIERVTNGVVKRFELRPDLWSPEKKGVA